MQGEFSGCMLMQFSTESAYKTKIDFRHFDRFTLENNPLLENYITQGMCS